MWPGSLFLLLDDLLQFGRHLGQRNPRDLHGAVALPPQAKIERAEFSFLVGIVLAEVAAAAFLPLDRRPRDHFAAVEEVAQIDAGVPAGVVFAMTVDADPPGTVVEAAQLDQRLLHLA